MMFIAYWKGHEVGPRVMAGMGASLQEAVSDAERSINEHGAAWDEGYIMVGAITDEMANSMPKESAGWGAV